MQGTFPHFTSSTASFFCKAFGGQTVTSRRMMYGWRLFCLHTLAFSYLNPGRRFSTFRHRYLRLVLAPDTPDLRRNIWRRSSGVFDQLEWTLNTSLHISLVSS
jgi:hypothetical protein